MQDSRSRRWQPVRIALRRYAPLELAALLTALGAALLVSRFSESRVAIALAGSWGENLGYYLVAFVREWRVRGCARAAIADLLLEFGAAEVLDSLVVRPLCMGFGVERLGEAGPGVVLGKYLADGPFYALAILGYALRRRLRPAAQTTRLASRGDS